MLKRIPIVCVVAILAVKMLSCEESAVFDPTIIFPPDEAVKLMGTADTIVLDVRSRDEYATGHINGAINLPLDELNFENTSVLVPELGNTLFVYCYSGKRSILAMNVLHEFGYTDIHNIGGIKDWPFAFVED